MQSDEFPSWYGKDARLLESAGDMHKLSYEYEGGKTDFTDFNLFAGIHFGVMDVDADEIHPFDPTDFKVIEIIHCLRGRFECGLRRDVSIHIAEGDFAVASSEQIPGHTRYFFPFNSFYGIGIVIDYTTLTNETLSLLRAFSIDLERLRTNLMLDTTWFTSPCTGAIRRAFLELYRAFDEGAHECFRLKVLELLFLIERFHDADGSGTHRHPYLSGRCVHTIRQIHDYLVNNLEERTPLDELARRYGISPTLFQSAFKDVYGLSPYRYMKDYKMHCAARLLFDGTAPIGEIAQQLGYKNASKFTSAFRDVMGVAPREYRKRGIR
jgi:AraC-like DNA-binding protein